MIKDWPFFQKTDHHGLNDLTAGPQDGARFQHVDQEVLTGRETVVFQSPWNKDHNLLGSMLRSPVKGDPHIFTYI